MTGAERIASAVIILGLLVVAGGVIAYRLGANESSSSTQTLAGLLPTSAPSGWQPLGPAEEYPAYRLNEKIDGEDIEYLSRGCLELIWGAYVNSANQNQSITVSIYDMANPENAAGIYESVRGPTGPMLKPLDLADEGYTVAGSWFLRAGRYYVEMQATADAPSVESACRELTTAIMQNIQVKGQ